MQNTTQPQSKPNRGRPPLGDAPMTHAQRQRKLRTSQKAAGLVEFRAITTPTTRETLVLAAEEFGISVGQLLDKLAKKL